MINSYPVVLNIKYLAFGDLSICLPDAGLLLLFRKSRSFRACIWQRRTKASMTKVTSRLEYTEVLHYYFLYLIPRYYMHKCTKVTCMFGFKWNNPNAIITAILLQFMYHKQCMYYPLFSVGNISTANKYSKMVPI